MWGGGDYSRSHLLKDKRDKLRKKQLREEREIFKRELTGKAVNRATQSGVTNQQISRGPTKAFLINKSKRKGRLTVIGNWARRQVRGLEKKEKSPKVNSKYAKCGRGDLSSTSRPAEKRS